MNNKKLSKKTKTLIERIIKVTLAVLLVVGVVNYVPTGKASAEGETPVTDTTGENSNTTAGEEQKSSGAAAADTGSEQPANLESNSGNTGSGNTENTTTTTTTTTGQSQSETAGNTNPTYTAYHLTVSYLYASDDSTAATAYSADIGSDGNYAYSVNIPAIDGYTASVDGNTVTGSISGTLDAAKDITVYYTAAANGDNSTTTTESSLSAANALTISNESATGGDSKEAVSYNLTIKYWYEEGGKAADDYSADIVKDSSGNYSYTVTVPAIDGYTAHKNDASGDAITVLAGNLTADASINVVYTVNDISYTVRHVLQKLDGTYDEDNAETETLSGKYGQLTNAQPRSYTGFTADDFNQVNISGEGIVVDIKYDRNIYTLAFNTNGGTYTDPIDAMYGKTVDFSGSTSTKTGYTFDGWYKDAALTDGPITSVELTGNTTVYAKWTAGTATYTVIYWKQQATDLATTSDANKKYDYAETADATRTATIGTSVSPTSSDQYMGYTHFHYNATNSKSVVVKADGSTVLNVYYDRDVLTITFKTWVNGGRGQRNYWNTYKTFTGLYGSTLATNGYSWPSDYSWHSYGDDSGRVGGTTQTYLDAFLFDGLAYANGNSLTLYGGSTTSTHIKHYLQNTDGSWPDLSGYANDTYGTSYSNFTFTNKYTGFTVSQYSYDGYDWNDCEAGDTVSTEDGLYIRHARNNYTFNYINNSLVVKAVSVLYDASLADLSSYQPDRPSGIPSYFEFTGWFKDPSCTQKFDFTQTMPAANVAVYAGWSAKEVSVTFVSQGGSAVAAQTIKAGETATMPADPTYTGYTFKGWYTDAAGTVKFDFNKPVIESTTVYAKWQKNTNTGYSIHYYVDGVEQTGATITATGKIGATVYGYASTFLTAHPEYSSYTTDGAIKSIVLVQDETANVININFYKSATLPYRIDYVLATDTTVHLASSVTVSDNTTKHKVVSALAIPGYNYLNGTLTMDLVVESSISHNVFTFKYEPIEYKISYDLAGGTVASANPATYNIRSAAITLNNPSKTGYTFLGWTGTDLSDATQTVTIPTGSMGNRSYTANWKINTFTITTSAENGTITPTATVDYGTDKTVTYSPNAGYHLVSVTVDGANVTAANTTSYTFTNITENHNVAVVYAKNTAVTVKADDLTAAYNGQAHNQPNVTVTGLLSGDVLTATTSGSITDAGTAANTVTDGSVHITRNGKDVTNEYDVTLEPGTLTVTPVAITVTADSAEKVYDGTALTKDSYQITTGAFVSGEGFASVTVTGSQTLVGSSANTLTGYTLNGSTKAGNYTITKANGTLKVTQASIAITITADSATKTYDGSALTKDHYTSTGTMAAGDEITSVTVKGSQTNAGNSSNVATAAVIKHGTTDVTANYKITYADGTLTVNPVSIELTAGSASKAYDGTALTKDSYTISAGAFVGTDGLATVTVTGSQTLVGTSDNTITAYTLKTGTVGTNYVITTVKGSLSVTNEKPIAITITANSASKTYDGAALTDGGYKLTTGSLATGDSMTGGTMTGTITDAGTVSNQIAGVKIMHGSDDVTANYAITYVAGSLTVKPIKITITAASDSKTYDGKPLTNTNYTTDGTFAANEGFASVTVSGSQTLPGTSANTISYTLKDNTKAGNYDITATNGSLTVNKASIALTIVADTATKTYDGTPLTAGYSKIGTLAEGDTLDVTVSGSQTDAGTSDNTITAYSVMHGTVDVTDNYHITGTNGILTVNPVTITITAKTASKTYDGTALTNSGYDVTGSFVGQDKLTSVTVTGSQLLAGSSDNTVTGYTLSTGTKPANYTINTVKGTLTVNKAAINLTITAGTSSKTYDAKPLSASTYTSTGTLAAGDKLTVMTSGSQTNAGTSANTVASVVVKHGDDVVTDNYVITTADGSLTVNPVKIIVKADSAEKVYDGTALTKDSYQITSGAFVGSDGFKSVKVTGSQTFAGTSDNTIESYALTDGTVAANYEITKATGTLKVTQASIALTITANSATKKYDGVALVNDGYTYAGTLAIGDTIESVNVAGVQLNAGNSSNVATAAVIKHGTTDVTANYKITYADGTLTVNPVSIELTAGSASKAYDGTALTKDSYTISAGAFVGTDGLATVTVTGSQTLVGTSDNTITAYTLKTGTVGTNYVITTVKGSLSVTNEKPIAITITANSASKTYDGAALTDGGYKLTTGSLATGDSMTGGTMTGTITDAGTVSNQIAGVKIMHGSDDVTANYAITYVAGSLTVKPIKITITAASDSKTYDGKPLTNSHYTVTGTFVGSDGIASATVSGSQLYAGSSDNTVTGYTLAAGTKAQNYEITKTKGTLTVNQASIALSLTADTASKTYDSTALTAGYTKTGDLATGDELHVTVAGSQTDAGTSDNTITAYSVMHDGTDVTANYAITTAKGTLTVNPVAIELKADSATKIYDGTALTKNGYTISTGAFVGSDGLASVTVEGSQTLVGTSANTITAHTLTTGTKAGNYTITYAAGTLEVTQASIAITVTAGSDSKTYGAALSKSTYSMTGTLATGDTITVTTSGSQTDAGTSANTVASVTVMHGTTDVTANYAITTANGTLTVNPIAIELTADSASKVYDGTALTKNSYTISTGAFVGSDGLAGVTITGSQTFVGTSDNTITGHTLATGTKAQNYSISYKKGTLEVTQASIAITITAGSDSKTYDGKALTDGAYTLTAGSLAAGDGMTGGNMTGTITNAGTTSNVLTDVHIAHTEGTVTTDVTANYVISYVDGSLTVKPVAIVLTANSATKEYDGIALTDSGYKITTGAFVGSDGLASVTVTGSQTFVGHSDNTITAYTLTTGTTADNYSISTVKGTLSVTNENPIAITITAGSASKTYDGTALTKNSYSKTGTLATGDELSADVTGTITDAGTAENVLSNVKVMHGTTDVTANYAITTANGTLTVNPIAIELTADSASKVYDGTALTKNSYTISTGAFVGSDGLAGVTITGSQTFVGTSDNTITGHTLATGTKAQNYSISYKKGTLEVTQASIAITITAGSDSKTYDGTPLSKNASSLTSGTLATGDTISSVTVTGSQTNAGSSKNTASAAVVMHGTTDVTANYVITYAEGTLTVNPVAIVLTANSASRAYNGESLTDSGYTITTGAFVGNDGLASVTVVGSQLFVGSSANTITKHTLSSGTVAGNYSITYAAGTLEVTQASIAITITADSGTKTYDGTALTKNTYTSTGSLATGDAISSVTLTGSQTDAGSSANVATAAVVKHGTTDVTANYRITYTNGTLTVNPVAIELTADSAKKAYDGTALTKNSYQITSGAFVTGEGLASVTVEGKQIFVGTSENKITAYTLKDGTKAGNYTITTKTGTLEITKASIALTLRGADQSWDYDGEEHNSPTYQITGNLATNDSASASMLAVIKNAGTVTNELTDVKVLHDNGDGTTTDVTENYVLTVTNGTLTINKLPVTIAANSATKVYDTTPLVEPGYAITSVGEGNKYNTALLGKLTLDAVTVTGSQTDVGSSANVPSDAVFSNDGIQDDISNYDVTYVNGTLTVTAVPPVPTPTPGGRSCQDDGYPAGYYWNGTACVIDTPTPAPTNVPNAPTPTPGNGGNTTTVTTPTPEAVTVSPAPNGNTTQPTYGRENGSWALLNLIMTIITMLLAIFELFAKKEKEEDPDENDENIRYDEDGNVIPNTYKRSGWYKVALAVFAILQIILFILTENMRLPMVIWDKWTLVNIIATIATVVIYAFARKWKKQDEDDDETAEQTH